MPPLILALLVTMQSTDIEGEAAGGVLRQIDSLEVRIRPTELTERLAGRRDPARARLRGRVAAGWSGEMQSLSDWISHHPEVGWHEFQAVDTPPAVLRAYG